MVLRRDSQDLVVVGRRSHVEHAVLVDFEARDVRRVGALPQADGVLREPVRGEDHVAFRVPVEVAHLRACGDGGDELAGVGAPEAERSVVRAAACRSPF